MLSSESDVTGNEEICKAVCVFIVDMDGIQGRRIEDIGSAPMGLLPMPSLHQHVLQFIL